MSKSVSGVRELDEQRNALLNRLVSVLNADERVLGAWLSGSDGRSEEDEWSDFDLQVAVDDSQFGSFLRDRPKVYAAVGESILVQEEMPSDNLNLGDAIYQLVYFRGGILVDWNCGRASRAKKPAGHKVLLEKRPFQVVEPPWLSEQERREHVQRWTTFFWAMAPIAVKYAARGATRQGARQTDLLARALVCLKRLLMEPSGPDPWLEWMNRPLEDEIDRLLPRLGPVISPQDVLDVIGQQCAVMIGMHDHLSELGVDVHPAMAAETDRLRMIASEVVAAGEFPVRRYR